MRLHIVLAKRIFVILKNSPAKQTREASMEDSLDPIPPDLPVEFDETTYLELNPDVADAVRAGVFSSGWEHWQSNGMSEGRIAAKPPGTGDFDELTYLDLNPDVLDLVLSGHCGSGYEHWVRYGAAEGRPTRPDATCPPGWNEGRYLRLNSEVAAAVRSGGFASGYDHWDKAGKYEARPGGVQAYRHTPIQEALRSHTAGINMFAFHSAAIGLGVAARGYAGVLRRLLPLHDITIPWDLSEPVLEPSPYAINLIHLNPDALPSFFRHYDHVLPSRYNVALWVCELQAGYASWRGLSRIFDEIWTPTSYVAASIRSVCAAPVHVIPYVVDALPEQDSATRADFGLDQTAFVFLYVFDLASSFDRKNPLAAVRAFRKAFGDRKDVQLVLKYQHPEADAQAAGLIERLARRAANIRTICETFPEERVYALLRACDCFVSPHRCEGFGLNIAAAMYLGKPVIATAYSGNMDFTTPENAFLVDYDLVSIRQDTGYYKANYVWADPSEDHLAALLATVMKCPEEAKRRAEYGQRAVRERLSSQAVAEAIKRRMSAWGL